MRLANTLTHSLTHSLTCLIENNGFYKMLRVSHGYGATRLCKTFPDKQRDADGVKTLSKKTNTTSSIDWQSGSGRPCLPTSTKLRVSHSAKKINHRRTIVQQTDASLGSVNTITTNDLQLIFLFYFHFYLCWKLSCRHKVTKAPCCDSENCAIFVLTGANKLLIFNGKTCYFQRCKYDVRITSPVAIRR